MRWESQSFQCPHCWESQSLMIDPMQSDDFVQDCSVCCNPIRFTLVRNEIGDVVDLQVDSES